VGGNITTSSNSYIVSSRKFTARDANGTGLFADDGTSGLSIADDGDATFTGDVTIGPKSNATVSVSESGGADVKMRAGSVGRIGTYSNHNLVITQNGIDALTIDTSRDATFVGDVILSGTAPTLRIQDSRNLNNPDWDNVSLGNIEFYTSDTTSPGARVLAEIEAFSNNAAASGPNADLIFKTSAIADSSPQTRLTIGYDGTSTFAGNVTAGSNSLTAGSLDINGNADISGSLDLHGDLKLDLNDNIRFGGELAITKESNGELKLYGGTNSTDGGFELFTWTGSAYSSAFTLKNDQTAAFSGDVIISDISSNRGIFRDNNGYNLNLGGGTVYSDGAYLSLSGGTRGGGTSIYKGRIEMRSGGSNYSAQADITGDIIIGTQWNGGTSDILTLDSSTGNVGIGTTSPQKKLDIASGDIRLDNSKSIFFATTDANIGRVSITGDEGSDFIRLKVDNNNSHVLHLNTTGVGVGTTSPSEKLEVVGNIKIGDNNELRIGTGDDLKLYHNGTNSAIDNLTGDLYISNYQDDGDIIFRTDDGSGGVEEYFRLDGSANTAGNPVTLFPDNSLLGFGSGYGDLQLHHDGSHSYIKNRSTGNLYIRHYLSIRRW
jgi:hypothetical protein